MAVLGAGAAGKRGLKVYVQQAHTLGHSLTEGTGTLGSCLLSFGHMQQLPVLNYCMRLTRAGLCCPCTAVLILYIGLRHGWWLKILRCCWSFVNSTGGGGSSNQSDSPKAKQGKAQKSRGADSDEDGSGDEEVRCACCADQSA